MFKHPTLSITEEINLSHAETTSLRHWVVLVIVVLLERNS